jgi:ribosomal protein S18 acetylase RimI-like enzyme
MIAIREANTNDVDTIIALGKTTFTESHSEFVQNDDAVKKFCDTAFNQEKISKDLSDKNIIFWIAFFDDIPVGFAKVILNKTNDFINHDKVCQLDKIYILNGFLGKQLGKQLHSAIIEKVTRLQFDCIWLVTYIYNYKAIEFYKKNQYQQIGFYDFIVGEKGYKNHVLSKKLSV